MALNRFSLLHLKQQLSIQSQPSMINDSWRRTGISPFTAQNYCYNENNVQLIFQNKCVDWL